MGTSIRSSGRAGGEAEEPLARQVNHYLAGAFVFAADRDLVNVGEDELARYRIATVVLGQDLYGGARFQAELGITIGIRTDRDASRL